MHDTTTPRSTDDEGYRLADEDHFFIVRKGTNARVLNKDNEPLIIERGSIARELTHYEERLAYAVRPIGVREWYDKYWIITHHARNSVFEDHYPKSAGSLQEAPTRSGI